MSSQPNKINPTAAPNKHQRPVRQRKTASKNVPAPLGVVPNVRSLAVQPRPDDKTNVRKLLIVKYPDRPEERNVATQVRPFTVDQGTSFDKTTTTHANVQTDKENKKLEIIPIPIPIYVPCPIPTWQVPVQTLVPVSYFVPVPIMVPLTRYSAEEMFKKEE